MISFPVIMCDVHVLTLIFHDHELIIMHNFAVCLMFDHSISSDNVYALDFIIIKKPFFWN
jgi:hypothetical protein